jgi:hypothetical protein
VITHPPTNLVPSKPKLLRTTGTKDERDSKKKKVKKEIPLSIEIETIVAVAAHHGRTHRAEREIPTAVHQDQALRAEMEAEIVAHQDQNHRVEREIPIAVHRDQTHRVEIEIPIAVHQDQVHRAETVAEIAAHRVQDHRAEREIRTIDHRDRLEETRTEIAILRKKVDSTIAKTLPKANDLTTTVGSLKIKTHQDRRVNPKVFTKINSQSQFQRNSQNWTTSAQKGQTKIV